MEITEKLIDDWKLEIAKQVQVHNTSLNEGRGTPELNRAKRDFLEGFYTALTCLERASQNQET